MLIDNIFLQINLILNIIAPNYLSNETHNKDCLWRCNQVELIG